MLFKICFIFLLFNTIHMQGTTEETFLAKVYRENSQIQSTNAQTFLEKWTLAGNETILDIGCGDGRITQLIATKVPHGSVKGIDISKQMIDLASESYPNLLFDNVNALEYEDEAKYDVITCLSTLHWFVDQHAILEKMKSLLKDDGKIYILAYAPLDCYWKPMEEAVLDHKWKGYLDQKLFYCQLPKEELVAEIQQVGLSVLSFESIPNVASFKGKGQYVQHIRGYLPHLNQLSRQYHEELLSDIGLRFLKWNPLNAEGCVIMKYDLYELILTLESS